MVKFRSVQPNASSVGAEDALDEKFGIALSHPRSIVRISWCTAHYVLMLMVAMARAVEARRDL